MSPAPRKKKKKKARRPEAEAEVEVEAEGKAELADSAGSESEAAEDEDAPQPLPGLGTRDGGKLREAMVAFEAGDYKRVRERCRELEASAEDAEVRVAAAELRSRVEVDPIQVVVLLACSAAVVAIVFQWIL